MVRSSVNISFGRSGSSGYRERWTRGPQRLGGMGHVGNTAPWAYHSYLPSEPSTPSLHPNSSEIS